MIDILPKCVSSVYFIWDPDWAWASLGKLSAMWEASLARRISEALDVGCDQRRDGWVYMGKWDFLISAQSGETMQRIETEDQQLTSRVLDRKLSEDEIQVRVLAVVPRGRGT